MKMVIGDPKSKKSFQTEVPKEKQTSLVGMKIGDSLDGGLVGAGGYKFVITGGSDSDGVPMRPDLKGAQKVAALLASGVGFRKKEKGARERKMVRGNAVSDAIAQLNVKVVESGQKPLEELFPPKPKEEKKRK
ncbi:30S ribosomal protein S6e [Candidatus Burarchaeum australiense]|nr:30S ribosomal protein S6e [Candidatus Burarchaeum australiense]